MSKRKANGTATKPPIASRQPMHGRPQPPASGQRSPAASRPAPGVGEFRRRTWLLAAIGLAALAVGVFSLTHRSHPPQAAETTAAPSPLPPAEQSLRSTLARLPRDPDAHRGLARYLLEQHRPIEALCHFRAAQELNPADADTVVAAARAMTQAGLASRALPVLRDRLARASADLDARRALAEAELAIAHPDEASTALAGAGAALNASAPAQILLGDARAAAGDLAGARAAYQRAVALEPEEAAGHDRLGRLALTRGEWTAAKQEFAAARERDPGDAGHGYRLGQAYWGAGERAEAERLWEEVAASSPGFSPAWSALGKAQQGRKEEDAAARSLVAAVNADPASKEAQFALALVMTAQGNRASAEYQRGVYYLETDRPHLALAEFRRMETIAPQRIDGPRMVALAYIRMKRLDLAAAEVQRGLVRHPHEPRLLGQLGLLHVLGRNGPRARQLCEAWLKMDQSAAEPYRLLGRIAREAQNLPEALRFDEQALAREPQSAPVCDDLSKTLAAMPGPENSRRAIDMARRATELNPRETDYWQQLGVLLRGAGQQEEAADALLRAWDLDPASVRCCSELVQIAAAQQRPEAARFYAGLVLELQSRSRAGDLLWAAIYRRPEDAAAHERLARFLLGSGDLRRASYQLEQVAALRPDDRSARRDLALARRLLDLQID